MLGLFEKLGQQVVFGREAVGGEGGGVQGGVGVFERVRAGQFKGAVEGAQTAIAPIKLHVSSNSHYDGGSRAGTGR